MKTPLILAAATSVLLTACGTVQTSNSGAAPRASASASGAMYCWKRNLADAGGNLICNWEASSRDACKSIGNVSPLSKGAVSGAPRDAGRCENGEYLVAVTTR
jgi:hypothetical protein